MSPRARELDLRKAAAALADDDSGEVTMAVVARRLGVAKPTLYRLARSRAELVQACVDTEAERLLDQLYSAYGRDAGEGAGSPLVAAQTALNRYCDDSPDGFVLLFAGRHRVARAAVRRIEDRVCDLLRRNARVSGAALAQPDLVAAAVLGAAVAVARRRLEDGTAVEPAALAASLSA